MIKLSLASITIQLLSCGVLTSAFGRPALQEVSGYDENLDHGSARTDAEPFILSTDENLPSDHSEVEGISNHAGHARWLVHAADYAVFSTYSTMEEGWPFSNVISISDGAPGNSTGRIIVYVATISQFAADVAANSKVSLGVSQAQANGGTGCQYVDAEWPLCARVSVFGHAKLVPEEGVAEAAEMMFARHPLMRPWAALAHKWAFYEIIITNARVLDFFGGFHKVSSEDYFAAAPQQPLAAAR